MRLLNIFECYRNEDLVDRPADRGRAARPESHGYVTTTAHPDGTVYYTAYREPETEPTWSATTAGPTARSTCGPRGRRWSSTRCRYMLADRQNRLVHSWPNSVGWVTTGSCALAGDAERVFVISDSRYALKMAMPMPDERFHVPAPDAQHPPRRSSASGTHDSPTDVRLLHR